jgi:replication fork protection complex subunit Tof1/Swi1
MSLSNNTSDVEAAEVLQSSIYYNGDILDSSLTVISRYKDQSIAYLDSVIHFAYVLLRMLEKHSKEKGFMLVRKKKARARKKKQIAEGREEDGEEEGLEKDMPTYAEHQFEFATFEQVRAVILQS